ncbi:MAG: alpha-mannosidase [Acidimicrobiales bacterium]
MHRLAEYTRGRLAQTSARLAAAARPETAPIEGLLLAGPCGRIGWADAQRLPRRPAALGEQLGPRWATYWLFGAPRVPPSWAGARVELLVVTHSEATLWLDGAPVQGLNTSIGDTVDRPDAVLVEAAAGAEVAPFAVEIAANGSFGRLPGPYRHVQPAVLDRCELARFDPEAWALHWDFEVLRQLEALDGLDPSWAGRLASRLLEVADRLDPEDRATWPAARAALAELAAHRNGGAAHRITAVGHAHLDTAWLWPIAETQRKALRTFSTQAAYLERWPGYCFAASQAQHYAWVAAAAPELWRRIRGHVEAGRWAPVGGMWVEPDGNLPSGESFVRQLLLGQRFFERELGRRCRTGWLPDTFGFHNQLPQLLSQAGLARFLTQKLSWSRFTQPTHHSFDWRGLDGTSVLVHFPPAGTYNSTGTLAELRAAADAYRDHDRSAASLLLFGHGDGGGGPTPGMIETLLRAGDLQGAPRTRLASPDELFDELEAEPGPRPEVVGELYLEYHRGTYTSQAAGKAANRRNELALHDAELLWAAVGDPPPRAELRQLWRRLCVTQFHDILPGTSIGGVHREAAADHAAVAAGAEALVGAALGRLCAAGPSTPLNTLGVARREVTDGPGGLALVEAPPFGAGRVVPARAAMTAVERADGFVLDNGVLRVGVARSGELTSVVELRSGREALAGPGNVLVLHDDRPIRYDAWDIDPYTLGAGQETPPAERASLALAHPLRAEVVLERRVGGASRMRQVVRLDAEAARVEVHCEIDWRERHQLLKVRFPLAVHADEAAYETPFGHTVRPTHWSSPADYARYEVPGHRWADLSEHGFGAALLSESKYGWSAKGSTLTLSLLRASTTPDPEADQGAHRFAYALRPHRGGWREAQVVAEGLRFNHPLRWAPGPLPWPGAFAWVDDANLLIDTVKRAEDDERLVLRLYELHGARGRARLHLARRARAARRATILEDDLGAATVRDGAVELDYRPYEVLTLLVDEADRPGG